MDIEAAVKLVLIVADPAERRSYARHFTDRPGVELEEYASIRQFRDQCMGKAYSGVMVDIRTLIQARADEKEFFSVLTEAFPVMRMRRGPGAGMLTGLVEGEDLGHFKGEALVEAFVTLCDKQPPRGVRNQRRKQIILNAMLSLQDPPTEDSWFRVSLWDFSQGGCFVVTVEDRRKGDLVWLIIRELENHTPIGCRVQWCLPWGADNRHLPGLGLSFQSIAEDQRLELINLMKRI